MNILSECFSIRQPDDFHVHVRREELMRAIVGYTAKVFARGLVMPNTNPPILTGEDALVYASEIRECAPEFEPLPTIKILAETPGDVIRTAKRLGVVAGKVMLQGATTNAQDGAPRLRDLYGSFRVMEEIGMVASLHGEIPDAFCLDRERLFLKELIELVRVFPRLKVVLEHITTREAVELVSVLPSNVAATITVHHLYLTTDDVIGGKVHPHLYCLPVPKRPEDRMALLGAAMSGNPKFFLGTDSAPHHRLHKECAEGSAGIFTAPVALPALVDVFARYKVLSRLEPFVSEFGARFYGLPLNEQQVTIYREDWKVPQNCGGVVPFKAGETLHWKVEA